MSQLDTSLIFRGSVDVIVRQDLEAKLASGKTLRIKFGIDPTAGKIHIGRAATIRHLKHFQELGHTIVIVIGSFTGQIGDSSDKESERPMLSIEQVKENMQSYEKQLARIFDTSKMEVHYNHTWFDKMPLQAFIGLQQLFSVTQMAERDNFAKRLKANERVGLHEFSYALLQGYDSVALNTDVEIGGTDQLFNLLAARPIQKAYDKAPQNVITYELLMGTDGRKMSTSWDNCIYVDDEPNDMFGKIMSINDDLMWDYYRLATELSDVELAAVKQKIDANENPRLLKSELAHTITAMYYDDQKATVAAEAFDNQFKDKELPDDIKKHSVKTGERQLDELLVELELAPSKGAARRLLSGGGVRLNQEKVETNDINIASDDVVQVGKRNFARIA